MYVNFEATETLAAIFDYDFDVHRILTDLGRHFKTEIVPGKMLLFLDEIGECPRAACQGE